MMSRIVHIYTPTHFRFEETKKSLLSLKKSIDWTNDQNNDIDVRLFIGDNGSPLEMVEWLIENFDNTDNCTLYMSDDNIGKARMVNRMYDESPDCNIVCSFDSDMIVPDESIDFIERMSKCVTGLKQFGVLVTNQLVNSCHIIKQPYHTMEFKFNKIIYGNLGVAGGCLWIKKKNWDDIGGYREHISKFGGNDGYLMYDVIYKLKKMTGIVENVGIIHPHESDKKYHDWKVRQANNLGSYEGDYYHK